MKNLIIVLFCVLVGCNNEQNELTPPLGGDSDIAINFTSNKETRASIKETFEDGDEIGLFGYQQISADDIISPFSPIMFDDETLYANEVEEGIIFTYDALKFFPNSGGCRFFAYSPSCNESNCISVTSDTSDGYPAIKYLSTTNIAEQVDLIIASTGYRDLNDPNVLLEFKHALAKVAVGVAYVGNPQEVKILSLSIDNIGSSAWGKWISNGFEWELPSAPMEYVIGGDNLIDDAINQYDSQTMEYTKVTKDSGELLVIPQTLSSNNIVTISYSINGATKSNIVYTPTSEIRLNGGDNIQINLNLNIAAGSLSVANFDIITSDTSFGTNTNSDIIGSSFWDRVNTTTGFD